MGEPCSSDSPRAPFATYWEGKRACHSSAVEALGRVMNYKDDFVILSRGKRGGSASQIDLVHQTRLASPCDRPSGFTLRWVPRHVWRASLLFKTLVPMRMSPASLKV